MTFVVRPLEAMRGSLYIILVAVVVGCSPKSDTQRQAAPSTTNALVVLDEAGVIAIARHAVSTNDTWVDRATFEVKRDGSGWRVFVQRHPIEFGGDRVIQIDETGRVIAYLRGL